MLPLVFRPERNERGVNMKARIQITVVAVLMLTAVKAGWAQAPQAAKQGQNFAVATITPKLPSSWKPVARVNGTVLVERDLRREMYTIFPYARQHNGFPTELEPQIRRGALQMIIFDELVFQEAKRQNMTISPARLAQAEAEFRKQFPSPTAYRQFLQTEVNGSQAAMREKIRRALLIEKFLKNQVEDPARVTLAQARAEYEKNPAQYKHKETLHIQSISIIPPNQTAAVLKEAKQRAEEVAKQAQGAKSYREFGLLAEKLSDDDFHVNMGDHKAMEASQLPPPIVQLAEKMKPGDVSGLIQLGNNYTIFRLEARTPAGTTPFAEVKANLQATLQKQKTEQLRSSLAERLRKNAKIETL